MAKCTTVEERRAQFGITPSTSVCRPNKGIPILTTNPSTALKSKLHAATPPMRGRPGGHAHSQSHSGVVNHRAQLANAYQDLGKELSSEKIKVVGNYTLGRVIGEGAYGKVRIGTHRLTSTRVAMKQIPKAMTASLTREIHHHRRLHHPNVTQLYEVIATENYIWLVTELCSGGELYDYLVEKGRLSESETRIMFGELCLAVDYVHKNDVVHRDLKLENVLLDERCHVKLGDFGFTREFEQGRMLETFCGTTGYAAPEMLLCKKYSGQEVDVWSLGIILYTLLVGTLPFDDDDEQLMKEKIVAGEYEDPDWLSFEARDLIRNILQQDPAKRLTIPQILAHPWYTKSTTELEDPELAPLDPTTNNVIDLTEDPPSPLPPSGSQPISIAGSDSKIQAAAQRDLRISTQGSEVRQDIQPSASSVASETTFHSATSGLSQSDEGVENDVPKTPEDADSLQDIADVTSSSVEGESSGARGEDIQTRDVIPRMGSQSTIRKPESIKDTKVSPVDPSSSHSIGTVFEEPADAEELTKLSGVSPIEPSPNTARSPPSRNSSSSIPPSSFPSRTPVRTKRRSVSSTLTNSPPSSPTVSPPPIAGIDSTSANYKSNFLLRSSEKAPLAFTTPLERGLLNSLSALGFDTAQVVHSVLTNACDSCSAIWWMLKKKAERKEVLEMIKEAERAKAARTLEDPEKARRGDKDGKEHKERRKEKVVRQEEMQPPSEANSRAPSPNNVASESERGKSLSSHGHDRKSPNPFSISGNIVSSTARYGGVPHPLGLGSSSSLVSGVSAPDLAFVPPTPVLISHPNGSSNQVDPSPRTPPANQSGFPFTSSMSSLMVSPSGMLGIHSSGTSSPDRERKDSSGSVKKTNVTAVQTAATSKPRSSSVSMLQRATSALGVAGLSRKKSEERVREKEREKEREKDEGVAGSVARGSGSSEEPKPHKLTKSPPTGRERETSGNSVLSNLEQDSAASTPTATVPSYMTPGSPWAFPNVPPSGAYHGRPNPAPTPANSPGNSLSQVATLGKPLGLVGRTSSSPAPATEGPAGGGKTRSRASILNAFRTWFYDDRRKRKHSPTLPTIPAGVASTMQYPAYAYGQPGAGGPSGVSPKAGGSIRGRKKSGSIHRRSIGEKRPSLSSRRSSSVNSRRSSINSIRLDPITGIPVASSVEQITGVSRQRSDASRRSLGSRTPTSERGEFSSRPSSVRSFQMTPINHRGKKKRHSKSSSTSSNGSAPRAARSTSSPLQQYHRRAGSGGSGTRVVRQIKPMHRPHHARTSSAASSIRSEHSRPSSIHEASETEGSVLGTTSRTASPAFFGRSSDERKGSYSTTILVAHRKHGTFAPPSAGRSSWKKAWGAEPPGWSSRSLQSPRDMLVDPNRTNIRDVFAGRNSITSGDDSDWVDEDDDEPTFVGGLGQASSSGNSANHASGSRLLNGRSHGTSSPMPGSPSIKKMELPAFGGARGRPTPARRNSKGSSQKGHGESTRQQKSNTGTSNESVTSHVLADVTEETAVEDLKGPAVRSRRQLPVPRNGPAFKNAIQEEDEDEEEE
ncbi:hypothetical protein FRC02_011138 [Tulasnella sp. 418]|nr:hypothetical protein FRC02_011138 [Tulasnella sp. 418]